MNRHASETVEAWPLDALTIVPAASLAIPTQLGPIPEGVSRRNGLWAPVDDEIENAEMEEEEYSDHGYLESRGDYTQEMWGADGADFNP